MSKLVIALGKKPPKSMSDEGKDEGAEPDDEYAALASGMMRAFEKKDTKALAALLRDCGFMGGHEDEDEDY